jgi:cell wall-associated NlpC family hydrolase
MVTFSPAPALAAPPALAQPPAPPETASEALKQYKELASQAEHVNEDLLAAKNDLAIKQAELDKASAELAQAHQIESDAHAQEEQFRGQVDALAAASFQGARFNNLSALLTGGSQQDFLDRASALSILASDSKEALDRYTGAVDQAADARNRAADAQRRAEEAKSAAEQLTNEIAQKKADLDARAAEAEKAYKRLSAQERQALAGPVDRAVYLAPAGSGAAGKAMEVAMAQIGKPYVYGADGPDSFDCSGLTMYAYAAAGVSLPHSSRAQYGYGTPVAYGQWQVGDLLFYGGSASTIHHVALYIGNGNIVHASTSGVPVKTATAVPGGGSDYYGAKRIVG